MDYFGESVVTSVCDIAACLIGAVYPATDQFQLGMGHYSLDGCPAYATGCPLYYSQCHDYGVPCLLKASGRPRQAMGNSVAQSGLRGGRLKPGGGCQSIAFMVSRMYVMFR